MRKYRSGHYLIAHYSHNDENYFLFARFLYSYKNSFKNTRLIIAQILKYKLKTTLFST